MPGIIEVLLKSVETFFPAQDIPYTPACVHKTASARSNFHYLRKLEASSLQYYIKLWHGKWFWKTIQLLLYEFSLSEALFQSEVLWSCKKGRERKIVLNRDNFGERERQTFSWPSESLPPLGPSEAGQLDSSEG